MRTLDRAKIHLLDLQPLESRLVLAASPVAVADSYLVDTASLSVAADGVLANDSDTDADPLIALLTQGTANGILSLAADGSFQYTPNVGFTGIDTFSYQAVTPNPTQVFQVDRGQSSLRVEATLQTPLGERNSSDISSLTGTISSRVTPAGSPFSEIHLNDLDLVLADGLTLDFDYGFFGSITATAPADPSLDPDLEPLQLKMVTPGPAVPVAGDEFNQPGNDLMLSGIADVQASGLLAGGVPSGPTDLTLESIVLDLSGSVSQNDSTVTATIPIAFSGTFPFEGNSLDLVLSGTVVAHGLVATAEASNEVEVTLEVQAASAPPIGRHLFYGDSAFDSTSAAAAIAPTIEPLFPGETSNGQNMSSYLHGINGLIVELPAGGSTAQITAADFTFRVGQTNDTASWLAAADPSSITIEQGAGPGGSDRVVITWPNGAIADTWLEVTLLANARTGLAEADTFYFGNLRGDVTLDGQVNGSDFAGVRSQPATFLNPAAVTAAHDTNRDRRTNATDLLIVREHATTLEGGLPTITPTHTGGLQLAMLAVDLTKDLPFARSFTRSSITSPNLEQAISLAAEDRHRQLLAAGSRSERDAKRVTSFDDKSQPADYDALDELFALVG